MIPERFEFTAADGRHLEALVAGPDDGTLLVEHHGTPGSAHGFWPPHLEQASARGLRMAAYSRPGSAGSTRDEGRSVGSCAADAAALAAATIAGVGPAHAEDLDWLDGMGAENLEEFAAARAGPQELEAFISNWGPQLREITGPQVLDSLGDLVSAPDGAVLSGEYADFAAAGIRHSLSAGIWGWFDDDLAILGDWGFDPAAIEVPVSVWHGREDRFVPAAHGEWLAAQVGGARGHLLDDHGHLSLALAHFGAILDELLYAAGQSNT